MRTQRCYLLCRMYTASPSQQVGSTGVWAPPVVREALYTSDIGDNFSRTQNEVSTSQATNPWHPCPSFRWFKHSWVLVSITNDEK